LISPRKPDEPIFADGGREIREEQKLSISEAGSAGFAFDSVGIDAFQSQSVE